MLRIGWVSVHVSIPQHERKPSVEQPCPPVTVSSSRRGGSYRALVVDDSITIRKAFGLRLAKLKQITATHFADCGENALEKAGATPYDLVFLDYARHEWLWNLCQDAWPSRI